MMCLLPLQWSWAAAASLCQHESDGLHFGHHDHSKAASELKSSGCSSTPSHSGDGQHPDCKGCTGIGTGLVGSATHVANWDSVRPRPRVSPFVPEPPVEQLLRPPLPLVA